MICFTPDSEWSCMREIRIDLTKNMDPAQTEIDNT